MEQMYTIKQFTAHFGISRETYYQWVEKGYLTPMKIGGSIRIPESEVQKMVDYFKSQSKRK